MNSEAQRQTVAAWLLWGFAAAMGIAALLITGLGHTSWHRFLVSGHPESPVLAIAGGFFGALIVQQRPRNPVGWLLIANAMCHGVHALAAEYALLGLAHHGGGLPGASFASWLETPPLVLTAPSLIFTFLYFPDGELPSPPWRFLGWSTAAIALGSLAGVAALSWQFRGVALLEGASLPSGSAADALATLTRVGQSLLAACALAAIASLVVRYRRSHGVARLQQKWFAFGAAPTVVLIVVGHAPPLGGAGGIVLMASLFPWLVGTTIAIRRYRLYDIDRLISRAVSYATLTALVTALYLVVSAILGSALGSAGGASTVATAGAAVAVATAFQPLRRRLQEFSDRRFRRRSYEASRLIGAYLDELAEREPEPGELRSVLATALGDPSAEVLYWLAEQRQYISDRGESADAPKENYDRVITRVDRKGEHLGVITHRRSVLVDDQQVVDSARRAAGVAFDHGRLQAQVLAQLSEVRASRARIVAAGDAERRKVERDLHDGAQQRLVALALNLRVLRVRAERAGAQALATDIEQNANEADAAIAELRELARGLHPPILTELGLAAAITSLAERCPTPVTVDAAIDRRYSTTAEATAYFVVAEALTNATKYAHASRVWVSMTNGDGCLRIEVTDDGVGGATIGAGSGLAGLRDRVDAVGGTLAVESDTSSGTRVRAELPA